jgi:hypothetical protein
MNAKEAYITVALLAIGALLNFGYPVVAEAFSIPVGMEFIIIAYCLIVMLVPLRMTEVVGIGILGGALNIITDVTHLTTVISMHAPPSELLMALFNLVSEPVGIVVCFLIFPFLGARVSKAAPFGAAFMATLASGCAYLGMVFLSNPHLIATQPAYPAAFLYRVVLAAVVNAVVVQLVFLVVEKPVNTYLVAPAEQATRES